MSESASALYSTIWALTRQTRRSNPSRRLVRTLGARRRLIARIVVVRGCRLTSFRWGSLSVFSGHSSEPQRARAVLVGAAVAAIAHDPATKARSRSGLVG